MKTTLAEMKNTLEGIDNRLVSRQGQNSNLEDRIVEIT